MIRLTIAAPVAIVMTLGFSAERVMAASPLLEVDVNDRGDILGVRDGNGQPLDEAPFHGIGGFDLVMTKDLLFGQVTGTAARCCKRGGVWYSCAEPAFTGISGTVFVNDMAEVTRVDGRVDGVWRQNLPESGSYTIQSAVIESLKGDVIAVVEKQGARYGMVISADDGKGGGQKVWYNSKVFGSSGQ